MYLHYKTDTVGVFKSLLKDMTDEEIHSLRKTKESSKINFLDALVRFEMPKVGVYFLFNNDDLVYIGQSIRTFERLNDHLDEGAKVFNCYSFVKCDSQQEAKQLEKELIIRYKPPLNKTYAKINIDQQSEFVSKALIHLNDIKDIYYTVFK